MCNVNNVNNIKNVKNVKNVNNINNVNCKSIKSATLAHHLGPIFGLVNNSFHDESLMITPPEFYPTEVANIECSEACLQNEACICSSCKCCDACGATCTCPFAVGDADTTLAQLLLGQETEEYL